MMNLPFAYFDPSAGSLLLQAIVGGFGGIVVVGRYLWMQFPGFRMMSAANSQEVQSSISNPSH